MSSRQISALLLIIVNLILCWSAAFDMHKDPGRMNWINISICVMNGICALALITCWGFFK